MLTEPLPTTLDVRKAAAREATVSGLVPLSELARLQGVLASNQGNAEAHCAFSRDEEHRYIVTVSVTAAVEVRCQRCLESMPLKVESENQLAIVGDDDQARQLPARYEPWLVEEEQGNLWSLVEDELILAVPIVSYHDTDACKQLLDEYSQPPEVVEEAGDNPFKVLEQLKPGNK
ncbi:MAG: YceD family protein [Halieaceae bacterium]